MPFLRTLQPEAHRGQRAVDAVVLQLQGPQPAQLAPRLQLRGRQRPTSTPTKQTHTSVGHSHRDICVPTAQPHVRAPARKGGEGAPDNNSKL